MIEIKTNDLDVLECLNPDQDALVTLKRSEGEGQHYVIYVEKTLEEFKPYINKVFQVKESRRRISDQFLTKKELEILAPKTIFRHGQIFDKFWVAIRGGIPDWAIYYMNINVIDDLTLGDVYEVYMNLTASSGTKLVDSDLIKFLVPCTRDAFDAYRF